MENNPVFKGGIEGNAKWSDKSYHIQDRIYDSNGTSCTVTTDPYKSPYYLITGGRMIKNCEQVATLTNCKFEHRSRVYGINSLSHTLTTNSGGGHEVKIMDEKSQIRKLTPLESWRLMGFDDSDFYKAKEVSSDTQLYKQAGNSIVVNVLEAIMGNLLVQERSDWLDELLS